MGVNYNQICVIGVCFFVDDLKVVTRPARYEGQTEYDTRTGKPKGTKQVLVQEEEFHYEWLGKKYDEYYDIPNSYQYEEHIYIGKIIRGTDDYGRCSLLEETLSLDEIMDMFEEARVAFPNQEINMYFVGSVG